MVENQDPISWPADRDEAIRVFLRFAEEAIRAVGMSDGVSERDVKAFLRNALEGEVLAEDLRPQLDRWWNAARGAEVTSGEYSLNAIRARLVVTVLTVLIDRPQNLTDHVSWILELCNMAGVETQSMISGLGINLE